MDGLITLWETITENLLFGAVGVAAEDIPNFWASIAIDWSAVLAGIVMLGMLLYGGFLYLTSTGEPQKVEQAQKTLINAVIGFAIIVLAWSVTSLVMRLFGVGEGGGSTSDPCTAGGNVQCEEMGAVCEVVGDTYICVAD